MGRSRYLRIAFDPAPCAAALAWTLAAACAPAGGPPPDAGPAPGAEGEPADSLIVVDEEDESPEGLVLAEAEQAWLDADYATSLALTDSLNEAWSRRPGVGDAPVRRLARLLLARGENVEAVDQLLYHPRALDESWREEMRAAAERMSLDELDRLSRRISRDERALGVVRAEYARALALAGDDELARDVARDLRDADLDDADERKVEDVLEGRTRPAEPRVRIAVVAPRSGAFAPVGDQLIEGARLAAARYQAETGVPVELVILDETTAVDSAGIHFDRAAGAPEAGEDEGGIRVIGGAEPAGEREESERLTDELPEEPEDEPRRAVSAGAAEAPPPDIAAVIGPVMTDGLRFASTARRAPWLAVLSPTASDDSGLPPHAYSLWDRARRDSLEATRLGNWLVSAFESRTITVVHPDSAPPIPSARREPARVAALHPDHDSGFRRARILREIVEAADFAWVGAEAYHPDSTTHESEIAALTEADPDFVYTIADGPNQVLQVAPQLHFYGLRGRITLVNQDWTHPVALRRLDEPFSEYRVAAVYFEREGNRAWERFAAAWDEEYRRSLPENAFAALGHDALSLVLDRVSTPTLVRPAAIARSLARLDEFTGATGRFSFDPETRRLSRSADIWMILNGELTEPDPQAIIDWSMERRAQEEERLEREAEEDARRGGDGP